MSISSAHSSISGVKPEVTFQDVVNNRPAFEIIISSLSEKNQRVLASTCVELNNIICGDRVREITRRRGQEFASSLIEQNSRIFSIKKILFKCLFPINAAYKICSLQRNDLILRPSVIYKELSPGIILDTTSPHYGRISDLHSGKVSFKLSHIDDTMRDKRSRDAIMLDDGRVLSISENSRLILTWRQEERIESICIGEYRNASKLLKLQNNRVAVYGIHGLSDLVILKNTSQNTWEIECELLFNQQLQFASISDLMELRDGIIAMVLNRSLEVYNVQDGVVLKSPLMGVKSCVNLEDGSMAVIRKVDIRQGANTRAVRRESFQNHIQLVSSDLTQVTTIFKGANEILLAVSSGGHILFQGTDYKLHIFDSRKNEFTVSIPVNNRLPSDHATFVDDQFFAVYSGENTIKIYSLLTGEEETKIRCNNFNRLVKLSDERLGVVDAGNNMTVYETLRRSDESIIKYQNYIPERGTIRRLDISEPASSAERRARRRLDFTEAASSSGDETEEDIGPEILD